MMGVEQWWFSETVGCRYRCGVEGKYDLGDLTVLLQVGYYCEFFLHVFLSMLYHTKSKFERASAGTNYYYGKEIDCDCQNELYVML